MVRKWNPKSFFAWNQVNLAWPLILFLRIYCVCKVVNGLHFWSFNVMFLFFLKIGITFFWCSLWLWFVPAFMLRSWLSTWIGFLLWVDWFFWLHLFVHFSFLSVAYYKPMVDQTLYAISAFLTSDMHCRSCMRCTVIGSTVTLLPWERRAILLSVSSLKSYFAC